jgi:chemotaxis methyl-accepting protein methylase
VTSRVRRLLRLTLFGKSPLGVALRLNGWVWRRLPSWLTAARPIRAYGALLHALARQQTRRQSFGTFFLRNRPELDLMRRLAHRTGDGSTLTIAVVACSVGAEVYSILWAIRSARPDLKVVLHAIDVSQAALDFAELGVYTVGPSRFHDGSIFERVTEREMEQVFERQAASRRIRAWLREGIVWHRADAGDPDLPEVLGRQDIVVANRFLCHMDPPDAERCLRNVARLLTPGGHLFVSGIDLDIRTKVSRDLGWTPLPDLIGAIHDGDPSLRRQWPCGYTGLEPLDTTRADWRVRYASVFQVGERR